METTLHGQLASLRPWPRVWVGCGVLAAGFALQFEVDRLGLIAELPWVVMAAGLVALGSGIALLRADARRRRLVAAVEIDLPEHLAAAAKIRGEDGNLARYVHSLGIDDLEVRRVLLRVLEQQAGPRRP